MTTANTESPIDPDFEREIAKARAEVLRLSEMQGVKPFTALNDFAGEAEMTADFDVDEFLRQMREDRDHPSTGNGK